MIYSKIIFDCTGDRLYPYEGGRRGELSITDGWSVGSTVQQDCDTRCKLKTR